MGLKSFSKDFLALLIILSDGEELRSIFSQFIALLGIFAIPPYATAPALVFVAVILIGSLSDFDNWSDFSESAPLVITAVMMPLSFSIADGLAAGILTYVFIKILTGKQGDLNGISIGLAVIFLCKFALL